MRRNAMNELGVPPCHAPRPLKVGVYRTATADERALYAARTDRPIYPLRGFVTVKGGTVCHVEDLREWGSENPTFEIVAPHGMHLIEGPADNPCETMHTLLCDSVADVRERASMFTAVPCTCG